MIEFAVEVCVNERPCFHSAGLLFENSYLVAGKRSMIGPFFAHAFVRGRVESGQLAEIIGLQEDEWNGEEEVGSGCTRRQITVGPRLAYQITV